MEYESFIEPSKLKENDLVILLLGPSGAGKSHIIENLTNCLNPSASNGWESCTSQVAATRIKAHPEFNDRIVLVDTPGFDNTQISDVKILKMIGDWMMRMPSSKKTIAGILYIDQISDIRPSGARYHRMRMFQEFCGTHAAKNVVFVTTMWDNPEADVINEEREKLHREWITELITDGAEVARFLNASTSAMEIIEKLLLTYHEEPVVCKFAQELAAGMLLENTSSVQSLSHPLPSREWIRCIDLDDPTTLTKDDIVIVIMGPTGSGKSNFIDQLTGQPNKRAGSDLTSCTSEIGAVRILDHPIHENKVVIVDTPGLNDTNKSDEDIIQAITTWIRAIVTNGASVHAIMYLHRITDVRLAGACLSAFEQLDTFFAQANPHHIFLVTTMWDELITMKSGAERERHLSSSCWKSLIGHGASLYRFMNTLHSARKLLGDILVNLFHCDSEKKRLWNLFMAGSYEYNLNTTASLGTNRNTMTGAHSSSVGPTIPLGAACVVTDGKAGKRARPSQTIIPSQVRDPEDLKKPVDFRPDDIVIIFMGPTGSGKSNMIDILTSGYTKFANIALRSSTSTVNAVRLRTNDPYYKDHLVLIDTPSFDDTSKTDFEILEIISRFLVETYKKEVRLAGLVYLQCITDNRMTRALYRSFHVFSEICGQSAIKNIALVTTIWDEVLEDVGEQHEKQIIGRLWGIMTEKGAIYERFDNTPAAGWNIISKLTADHRRSTLQSQVMPTRGKDQSEATEQWKLTLALQEEMVTCRKSLSETRAAQALDARLPLSPIGASHDLICQHENINTSTTNNRKKRRLQFF